MKRVILTAACVAAIGVYCSQAQSFKISNPITVNPVYTNLMNKDMGTVMKDLKMSAKDTIGKTGTAYLSKTDPTAKFNTLKVATGEILGFKDNKLTVVLPKQK